MTCKVTTDNGRIVIDNVSSIHEDGEYVYFNVRGKTVARKFQRVVNVIDIYVEIL